MNASLILRIVLLSCALVVACDGARAQQGTANPPAPRSEQYRVGPGDALQITIHSGATGADPIVLDFPVASDGTIDVVAAGRLTVAGLSTSEIQDRIRRRLIDGGFMVKPFVAVNVKEYLSQCVNVSGAVTKQGRFCLQGATYLLDVLSKAEGVVEKDAGRTIVVSRQGAAEPITVDRRELVGADTTRAQAANIRVLAGDNVHVPVKPMVCVTGALEAGGCFAFEDGDTLLEAISRAGGLNAEIADRKNVTIRRRSGQEIKTSLDEIEERRAPAPLLEPDDQITVGVLETLSFCVTGQVAKPDCFTHVGGLTVEGAISRAGGIVPNKADRQNIVVKRRVGDSLKDIVVNLDDASEKGARFGVEPDDQITVPALDCLITVGGGVRTNGQHEYKTGMTLIDAIQLAGGTIDERGWSLGKLSRVSLRRGESVQEIDAQAIIRGKATDVRLQCGDRIFVPPKAGGGM